MKVPAAIGRADPRQLKLIGYGGLLLLAGAVFAYLLLPQWRAHQVTKKSLHLLESAVTSNVSLDVQVASLEREVSELQHTLKGDASNLPERQMEAFVIGRLQTISWRNELDLVGVQPRQGKPLNQFNELIFDVELEGGYFAFFKWLLDIGDELGFVVVKSFAMSVANAQQHDEPRLSVNLTLASYRNRGE